MEFSFQSLAIQATDFFIILQFVVHLITCGACGCPPARRSTNDADIGERPPKEKQRKIAEPTRDDLKPVMSYVRMFGILIETIVVARIVRTYLICVDPTEGCALYSNVCFVVPLVEGFIVWLLGVQSELQGSLTYTLLGALCTAPLYLWYPMSADLDAVTALVAQSFFRATSVVRAR